METQSSAAELAVSGAFRHQPFPKEKLRLGHARVDLDSPSKVCAGCPAPISGEHVARPAAPSQISARGVHRGEQIREQLGRAVAVIADEDGAARFFGRWGCKRGWGGGGRAEPCLPAGLFFLHFCVYFLKCPSSRFKAGEASPQPRPPQMCWLRSPWGK